MSILYSANFKAQGHMIAFFKVFHFSDTGFDGHKVTSLLGDQGCLKLGFADPNSDRDHTPSICHHSRNGFYILGMVFGNGDEEPWGGSSPEPYLAAELDDHELIIELS